MQFYKFEGFSTAERHSGENDSRRIMCEKARRISTKTNIFNLLQQSETYLFVNDASGDIVTIGIIVKNCSNLNDLISKYLRAIGTELMETCLEEVTFSTLRNMLGYDELNQMIGLDDAKKVINQALNYCKAQKLFADRGMKRDHPTMHMIFTGNPGTAKTTVARLFAKIMKENNLLSKGNLIEVGRGDLVGKYVGWTAPMIQKKFKEAQGSVLFIDEAYSLVDDRNGSFGDEAISTIVQEMENHRDNVVVIFAGYPDKMECFLQKNPGLRSRIAYHVPFSDYDTESLCEIAKLIAKQKGLVITEEAYEKLSAMFDAARTENDFGNGRYVRNAIEKARMAQATRLLTMDLDSIESKDISTITADDIEFQKASTKSKTKQIGFCS